MKPEPKVRAIDRPDLDETFSDSVGMFFFDGKTLRLEFCVTRYDEPKPPGPPTGRRYPVARLVLDQKAMIELFNQVTQIGKAMQATGLIKREPPKPPSPPPQMN